MGPFWSSWDKGAYLIDAYRLVPRAIVFAYAALVWKSSIWFMGLPDPSAQQAAFVTLVAGFFVPLTNWYMLNGIDWDKRRQSGSTPG